MIEDRAKLIETIDAGKSFFERIWDDELVDAFHDPAGTQDEQGSERLNDPQSASDQSRSRPSPDTLDMP